MHPKLFHIPGTPLTVWSYGTMMVIAFLAAVYVIRRLSRDITPDPQLITNASLYALIAGVFGARLFYVIHYFDRFRDNLVSVFYIWQGGLELLGGVILAIAVIFAYLLYHKLPVRRYLDVLAIGLMVALAIGRIGCFLRGCCFGRPTDVPWAVRFPYASDSYYNQIYPNPKRNRPEAYLKLPPEFFGYKDSNGKWVQSPDGTLKPFELLTPEQKRLVTQGPYRCLPVHPTELYSSLNGAILAFLLYLFWRRQRRAEKTGNAKKVFAKPGCTFALMFMLYGCARFLIEFLRDDNPFEYGWWAIYKGGTISQNLGIYLVILGATLLVIFQRLKPDTPPCKATPDKNE